MAIQRTRRWTDRDGTEWEVVHNPSVEEDPSRVRQFRERLLFRGAPGRYHAPAVFGSSLEALGDGDLQGLLDQAREKQEGEESPWATGLDEEEEAG